MAHTMTNDVTPVQDRGKDDTASLPGFARRIAFGVMLVVTGVIGWAASGILILEKLELYRNPDHVTSCDINPWVSCGQVMQTWQSELFGFPNPFIGLVGFTVVITTGMALLAEQHGSLRHTRTRRPHPQPRSMGRTDVNTWRKRKNTDAATAM